MRWTRFLLLSISGFAADITWNNSVNGSSWNFANHWAPPGIPGTEDTAVFNTIENDLSDQFMISIIAPVSVGSLKFNHEHSQTSYWIFGANSIQLNSSTGNSQITVTANNNQYTLLDTAIILGKDLDIANYSNHPLIFAKAISGLSRNVNIFGTTIYSGEIANTYSGITTVRQGTLVLNKENNTNAIAGDLVLHSGVVKYRSNRQISPTSVVTLYGQSICDLGSHQELLKTLQFEKSLYPNQVLIGTSGGLSITDTLALADHSMITGKGTLFLTGENAQVTFEGTSQNGQIDTALHLGNRMRTFAVHSFPRLSLNGPISEGGIIKTGGGILDISSSAHLSGLSIQEGGIHLNGYLESATPIQIYPDAFLYGAGSIHGNLMIQGTMSVGEVIPDSTPSHTLEYFSFDKLHMEGTLPSQLLFLTGDFTSNYVSEGIQVDGDILFSPESTIVVKFSPKMFSRINANGKIVLDSTNILVEPSEGIYHLNESYHILYAGAIEGKIGTVKSKYAMINPLISYITEDGYSGLSFSLSLNNFSNLFATGNAAQVAAFLDQLAINPKENSPIILEALINTLSEEEISAMLSQLHPSCFTSLSVTQENDLLYIRNAIYSRLSQNQQNCIYPTENHCGVQIWGGAFGGNTQQTNQSGEPGYHAQSPGALLALDAQICEHTILGGGIGYIYTFHNWKKHGDANFQTVYGSIYSQYAIPKGFCAANITGGYSFYDVNRTISIGPGGLLHATADSHFGGFEGAIDLKMGAHFPVGSTTITPFLGLDYMVVHQNGTQESGARVLNLNIKSHTADLLTSEGGFECNFCHWKNQTFLKALLRFSAVAESRFFGRYENATFATGGDIKVKGLYPSRILGAFGAGLSASFSKNTLSLSYQAKTNWDFTDQFLMLEYLWRF